MAWQLENQTAVLVAHALRHLQLEQSVVDGYGTGGDGSGRSSGDSSSTERAALLRNQLTTSRESIKAEIEALIEPEPSHPSSTPLKIPPKDNR